MAAGDNAGSRRSGRPAVAGGSRRWACSAALRALGGLVLVLGAGCTSRRDVVPAPLDLPLTDSLVLKPLDRGRLSSSYGTPYNPITKRQQMHRGIDWAAPRGTPVRAAGDGVVVAVGRLGTYGHYLRVDHGGRSATAYAHLDGYTRDLRPGRLVRRGDPIATVGSTGRATAPQLHYEILIAGRQVDPLAAASLVAADSPDPPVPVTRARFRNTPESDRAALAAGPRAGDFGRSPEPSVLARPLEAQALIRVEDLLRRYAP